MRSETSPLLSPTTSHTEDEIVSYVKSRRESIASIDNKIPNEILQQGQRHPPKTLNPISSNNSNSYHFSIHDILSDHDMENGSNEPKTTILKESKILVVNSIPLMITYFLQYSLNVISVISVGKLGSKELAAISLSTMTSNISGIAIIQGISTCLDTLCAQAYGRKDFNNVGIHFIRCNYFIMLLFIPIWIFWNFGVEKILIFFIGENEIDICKLASNYLKVLSYGLPGFILFENGKHFLQSQGIFHISTYILFIAFPFNILLNYILVWSKINIGFLGASLAIVLTNWFMAILLYGYILFYNNQCWPKQNLLNKIYFINWKKMIDLSIPGVLMVEAEWLAFEIITFEAAKFGEIVLASQSIISSLLVWFYQASAALGMVASSRVALFIGSAYKNSAKKSSISAIYTSLIFGIFNFILIFRFRRSLCSIFSNDSDVIEVSSKVLIIGAIYQVNDFLCCTTSGLLRAQGRQKIGAYLYLIGYYLIALPIAYYLAFIQNLQLIGLWCGMIIALAFVSISQLIVIIKSNWDDIIDECVNEAIAEEDQLAN
ncbi:uncharacterized protein KGF55_004164 [Candida pseudojiufengensis]|uniref:uncharacterized protein n=1 Tax=Candida pseudojiufengensis TaxID=497109 RepID=UPI0022247564|nr:uncharacterized protein KGF55_004164 [Candida pseudojiufengensis]KAI5961239.1 hypothetical protein KGF55_004164 [Candida pseudojiufengensis]